MGAYWIADAMAGLVGDAALAALGSRILQERVDPQDDGCLVYTGRINRYGYGEVQSNKRGHVGMAHRLTYLATYGPIPAGLQLDHLCRNRACVKPEHLEAVAPVENWQRGDGITAVNARKTHCKHGHEFTPENTYIFPSSGWRQCRACVRDLRRRKEAVL